MKKNLLLVFILSFTYNLNAQQCDNLLPVFENFSDTNEVSICWDFIDGDVDGHNWYVSNIGGNNGLVSESYRDDTGVLYPNNWAITQVIDLRSYGPSSNIQVNWKVKVTDWSFDKERYAIYASTSNNPSTIALSPTYFTENMDGTGGNWVSRSLDISSLAGNFVYIAFRHFASVFQDAIVVDDVSLTGSGTLGIDDFDQNAFKHFYNDENDLLTLKSSNMPFSGVKIYNLLGQNVIDRKLYNTSEAIDLSALVDGIYIAQIMIDNTTKSIKFLKQ